MRHGSKYYVQKMFNFMFIRRHVMVLNVLSLAELHRSSVLNSIGPYNFHLIANSV